jgi:PIN domain nuclease of toxin-antitoxin system
VRLLLDTHAFHWFVLNDSKLSIAARRLIADPANTACLSMASYWELAIKVGLGRYQTPAPFEVFIRKHIRLNRFRILPITIEHAAKVAFLPHHHRDPFDRMLIAQAIVEGMPILSADAAFHAYPVTRLW